MEFTLKELVAKTNAFYERPDTANPVHVVSLPPLFAFRLSLSL
jgi:hypothetical protein